MQIKHKLNFGDEDIFRIISEISNNSGIARIVGGAVRDSILHKNIKDIDIATNLLPEKILQIFNKKPFKSLATGISHGTITVIMANKKYEITTLRQDLKTDGRRAEVAFTFDFEEDAKRRDFTINALSYDLETSEIYDYFGGIKDLENGVVKFIGDADARIKEDYLRILRFFRFSCYYSDNIDKQGLEASERNRSGLANLSKERITYELKEILASPNDISNVLSAIEKGGILRELSFGYEIDTIGIFNFEKLFWSDKDFAQAFKGKLLNLRLVFLLFSIGRKKINDYLKLMKFRSKEVEKANFLYEFINKIIDLGTKKDIYFEICKIWYYHKTYLKDALVSAYILRKLGTLEVFKAVKEMNNDAPRMPVSSDEIKSLGFERVQLGIRKKYLESVWIKSGFSITKDELMKFNEKI